jgi:hypothetical protein
MATPPPAQQRTSWLALSILYVVLFSFPLLQIFNRNTLVFGIPLLILYLLLGWLLFIWVIYRFSRRLGNSGGADDSGRKGEQKRP